VVHPQGQTIARNLEMDAAAVVLAALFGFIVIVTAIGAFPPPPVLQLGAGAQPLNGASARSAAVSEHSGTMAAAGSRSLSVAIHGQRRPRDWFSSQRATTTTPVIADPSRDRRVDLMDMAISIRWHRGATSDLPPGSD
jgi:hypothetical protein